MIRIFQKDEDIKEFIPLMNTWIAESNANFFGMTTSAEGMLNSISKMVQSNTCDVFVMRKENKIVGLLGMRVSLNPFCTDRMAWEHFWYIMPDCRGNARKFMDLAKEWAIKKDCKFLVFTANRMASDLTERIEGMYKKYGMEKYVTAYVQNIEGGN